MRKIKRKLCQLFDWYYNPVNGEWVKSNCTDEFCEFCGQKPDKHPKDCERCSQ